MQADHTRAKEVVGNKLLVRRLHYIQSTLLKLKHNNHEIMYHPLLNFHCRFLSDGESEPGIYHYTYSYGMLYSVYRIHIHKSAEG
jgi:hypothetical protein